MVNLVRGNIVRSLPWLALPCVALAQGCDFIGDVSLGNNDDKGGSVATGGSGSPTGGTGSGGSDSGGADDSGGGSVATGGTRPSTGGASNGGSGSSNGGTGTAGAGEGGVPSGGSSSGSGGSGGASQGGAAGSAGAGGTMAGAGGSSGAGAGGTGGVVNGSYLGCHFIGGIDRVVVSKRDVANNRCVGLVLWDAQRESGDLELPDNWAVEAVVIGSAEECPSRTGTRVQATVTGSLTFLDVSGGIPTHVAVDATIDFAAGQPATGSERLIAESVDLRIFCNQVCGGEGPTPACNDNPMFSSIHGRCTAVGTCVCNEGYEMNPATGKCL